MPSSFRMQIGADLDEVAKVNAAFADFAEAHGVSAAARRSVMVALDELLTNTVSYGLPAAGGEVVVEVALERGELTVALTDNGTPFDPFARTAPDTTLSIEERPIGGLGIHLVRQLVDNASYHRRSGRNVVVLTKHLVDGAGVSHRGEEGMEITTRTQGDVSIVAIAGNLDSVTSPQAQKTLESIVAGGGKKLAVDFSALDYISSAGLRVLLGIAKQVGGKGGALRTFGHNETVKEVFDISGFSAILKVFPSEADALAGF